MAEASQDNSANSPPPPPVTSAGVVQEVGVPVEVSLISESKSGGLEQYPMTDAIRSVGELGIFRNQGLKVNLAQFGVLVGVRIASGDLIPLQDNFYWFGEIQIPSPSWIVLATGKGDPAVTNHAKTGHPVFWFHWGKSATIFNGPMIVPIVFQIGAILIGNNVPKQLPPSKV